MVKKLVITVVAMLVVVGFAAADEFDAVINDASRAFTRRLKAPEKLNYGKLTLDSKGKVVSTIYKEGQLTRATKVARGVFDEKKKKWLPGETIEGGIGADLFKDAGKALRVRVTLGDDGKTITQILVTDTDWKMVSADGEFDAIYKGHGAFTNGRGPVSYVRVELDEGGRVINHFALTTSLMTRETKVALGKYNEQEKRWEADADIPNGVYGDIFRDPGAKNIYVRITYRADGRGIAQMLVRQIGEQGKK
jgi:hypothetical protein